MTGCLTGQAISSGKMVWYRLLQRQSCEERKGKLMKTRIKKFAAVVMAVTAVLGSTSHTVWAGTSDSMQIGGYTAWGNLEIGTSSASAITGCPGNSSKSSEVRLYYGNGEGTFKTIGRASSLNNLTVATARVKVANAQIVCAKGIHVVTVAQTTWQGETSNGAIFDNAEEK